MKRILALLTERRPDHRAVFSEFARRLEGVLRPPAPFARVRAVSR